MSKDPSKEELSGRPLDKEEAKYIAGRIEECSAKLRNAQAEIATEVWGQDRVIGLTLTCMVAGGHLLSVGAPGLAKTRLVSRVATVMGLDFKRVQFTPDLMPSDILGSEVLEEDAEGKRSFRLNKGPVFTQFLMADEINRAGPRTQSALLEAMQEKRVTVAGHTYTLQRPFHVMATQNPIEQEGTYPLPEAQLDRFLMRLDVDYPDEPAERRVMIETTGSSANIRDLFTRAANGEDLTLSVDKDEESRVRAMLDKNDLIIMQKIAKTLPLGDKVVDAVMKIVRNARPGESGSSKFVRDNIAWGPGPRAVQAFALAAKARALMEGRLAPSIEDILAVVDPVLEHRMALTFSARAEGVKFADVKAKLIHGI
ncbi:MAG: AAA family ATPase [Micavibrio sp.]